MSRPQLIGLSIECVYSMPASSNHIPPTWPPALDFPVVIDNAGKTISRYGDSIWDVTPWANRKETINFGDGPLRKNDPGLSVENATLLRQIVAIWLYAPNGVRTVSTLTMRFDVLRTMLIFLSKKGIAANEVHKDLSIIEMLPQVIRSSRSKIATLILHDVWEARELLGFYILDNIQIQRFSNSYALHQTNQTAYIPPRIWTYQVTQLKKFIDDFILNIESIKACFEYTMEAYENNGLINSHESKDRLKPHKRPFLQTPRKNPGKRVGRVYHGAFINTLERFGIKYIFQKWLGEISNLGPKAFTSYFYLANVVGSAYIANFSMMRIGEIRSLRSNCFRIETDSTLGLEIHVIQGRTTKTINDENACWITTLNSELAVRMLRTIARLRTMVAIKDSTNSFSTEDKENPFLLMRPYEPWRTRQEFTSLTPSARPTLPAYSTIVSKFPKLFNAEQLQIQPSDLEIACLVTPTLDPNTFSIGKIWPLAWHQLRRTGAVNMNASGLVSDPSLQYQLKHASPWMSRYYSQGFHHVNIALSDEARSEYIKSMYEAVAAQFRQLQSERFFSLHGGKRKSQILQLVEPDNHENLIKAAEIGSIAYRPVFMGVCTSLTPCPYGGIDYVMKCAGTTSIPACENLLVDINKRKLVEQLSQILKKRIIESAENSPLKSSLKAQLNAVEKYLNETE